MKKARCTRKKKKKKKFICNERAQGHRNLAVEAEQPGKNEIER